MAPSIDDIAADFSSVDEDLRLSMLLDFAKKLPALPPALEAEKHLDTRRVHECMTPVHLWVLPDAENSKRVRLHVAVAEEAPTVKGILSIIVHAYDRTTPAHIATIPSDLLSRLGLESCIRMNRAVGINAIIARIKREAAAAAGSAS
jgi:cysteine desulfuration protein SufE